MRVNLEGNSMWWRQIFQVPSTTEAVFRICGHCHSVCTVFTVLQSWKPQFEPQRKSSLLNLLLEESFTSHCTLFHFPQSQILSCGFIHESKLSSHETRERKLSGEKKLKIHGQSKKPEKTNQEEDRVLTRPLTLFSSTCCRVIWVVSSVHFKSKSHHWGPLVTLCVCHRPWASFLPRLTVCSGDEHPAVPILLRELTLFLSITVCYCDPGF